MGKRWEKSKKATDNVNFWKIHLRSTTEFKRVLEAELTFWIRQQFIDRDAERNHIDWGWINLWGWLVLLQLIDFIDDWLVHASDLEIDHIWWINCDGSISIILILNVILHRSTTYLS